MSVTLESYPEYQARNDSWLGRVPVNWTVEPLFVHLHERQERNFGMIEKQVLSLSYGRILKKAEEDLHGLVPGSFETYQIVNPGNLIQQLPCKQQYTASSLTVTSMQLRGSRYSVVPLLELSFTWLDVEQIA